MSTEALHRSGGEFPGAPWTIKFPSFESEPTSSSTGYQQDTLKPSNLTRPSLENAFSEPGEGVAPHAHESKNAQSPVPPSPITSLHERVSRSESPYVTVTPPQPSTPTSPPAGHTPTYARTHHSSHTSHPSIPNSDDSFSSIFFRPGNPTASAQPLAPSAFFYQQGPKTHSSPDLIGPLLEDYYNAGKGGFNPQAESTPHGSEESFRLAPPGHPSSLPRPALAAPFVFPSPSAIRNSSGTSNLAPGPFSPAEPDVGGGSFFKRKAPSFSSLRRWLPGVTEPDVERGDNADRQTASSGPSSRRRSSFSDVVLGRSHSLKDASVYPHPSATRSHATLPGSDLSSSPDITLDIDVFSSNPSQPSFCPVPSEPSVSPTSPSHSRLMSLSASLDTYATPPTPPSPSRSRELQEVLGHHRNDKSQHDKDTVRVPARSVPIGDVASDTSSEHRRWSSTTSGSAYLTPATPSPPPRRGRLNPRSLSQRVNILSVIDASPTSATASSTQHHGARNTSETSPTRRTSKFEDRTLSISGRLDKYEDAPLEEYLDEHEGSFGEEEGDWRFVRRNPWKDSWNTEASRTTISYYATTNNAPRRSSLQNFWRGTRAWLGEGTSSMGTGPRSSYTSVSTRGELNDGDRTVRSAGPVPHSLRQQQKRQSENEKSPEEIAEEEFMSRVSTPSSNEIRTLRSRPHRWSSRDDGEGMSIRTAPVDLSFHSTKGPPKKRTESMATPTSPVSPKGKHKHTNTAPFDNRSSTLMSTKRDLVLPRLVEKRQSTSTGWAAPLWSPTSPPPRPRRPESNSEGGLILTPKGSPSRQYFGDMLATLPQRRVRIISPDNSPSPRIRNQSQIRPNPNPSRPTPELSSSSNTSLLLGSHVSFSISSQQKSTLRLVLSSPRLSLNTLLPAQVLFLMGFVLGPWAWLVGGWLLGPDGHVRLVDRDGRTIMYSDQDCGTNPSRASNIGDSAMSLRPREHPPLRLASGMAHEPVRPSTWHRVRKRICVLPISSDSPCDWVWRCRVASIGSVVVLSACVIVAITVAARGRL
ncbi:uncharacterized protein EI90DRAFT_3045713 [Cantharellus anzutake]|uniref:uncharacterized protein n=1 Tax=Cantharellus anzutake TaxID=1750568 RepID=UPI0019057672|nr:uncharacterized protein EI90DRAFT_3045713 [Cantharellus anzutake]KAF8336427.1 hypothetical protein EI90DRAFT_3045713 [Cantharellus anzutake]